MSRDFHPNTTNTVNVSVVLLSARCAALDLRLTPCGVCIVFRVFVGICLNESGEKYDASIYTYANEDRKRSGFLVHSTRPHAATTTTSTVKKCTLNQFLFLPPPPFKIIPISAPSGLALAFGQKCSCLTLGLKSTQARPPNHPNEPQHLAANTQIIVIVLFNKAPPPTHSDQQLE